MPFLQGFDRVKKVKKINPLNGKGYPTSGFERANAQPAPEGANSWGHLYYWKLRRPPLTVVSLKTTAEAYFPRRDLHFASAVPGFCLWGQGVKYLSPESFGFSHGFLHLPLPPKGFR